MIMCFQYSLRKSKFKLRCKSDGEEFQNQIILHCLWSRHCSKILGC